MVGSTYRRKSSYGGNAYARMRGYKLLVPQTKRRYSVAFPSITSVTSAEPRMGRRVRPKLSASRTLTKTKTEQKRSLPGVTKTGDNSSMSYFTFGDPVSFYLKRLFRYMQGRKTTVSNSSSYLTSGTGVQASIQLSILNSTNLNSIKLEANAGVATANALKLYLGYAKHRLVFKNQSNCVGKVQIYDIVSKYITDTSIDSPIEAWTKGYTDLGLATQPTIIGNTPFNSPEFRRCFNVKSVRTFNVEPGQQHEHTVIHKINRVYNTTVWDNIGTQASVKGITSWIMVVFQGSLGHETDNTKITYMPMKLDYVQHTEYNYGFIPYSTPSYTNTNNLSTAVVDFDFMGETADADVNNVQS